MPEVMSIEVDEEFDPRPVESPFGLRGPDGNLNFKLIGGIATAVILVLLLVFVVIKPFSTGDQAAPPSKWTPKDPTTKLEFLETYAGDSTMVTSIQASLDSWAKFYTTGRLEDLSQTFDLTGEQFAKLSEDQPSIAAAPEAGLPSVVELGPVGKVERTGDIFTVRVVVKWTKPGSPSGQTFKWDIDMKSSKQAYVLKTVRETDTTEKQPIDFCGAIEVVAGLDSNEKINKELKLIDPAKKISTLNEIFSLRVKAWTLLENSVAGTDSKEDVTAIVKFNQALVEATDSATSLSKVEEIQNQIDVTDETEALEERVAEEGCNADITDR